jgi:hypothetical protein
MPYDPQVRLALALLYLDQGEMLQARWQLSALANWPTENEYRDHALELLQVLNSEGESDALIEDN